MGAALSPTSAMVLLFASEQTYQSDLARKLFREQDLSSGLKLFERLSKVSPLFPEVVKNRKFAVSALIRQALKAHPNITQVCVAAAGQDPLGVDIAAQHPGLKVFEIDAAPLDFKQQWARKNDLANLFCVQGDLCHPQQVCQSLAQAGWQAGPISCWVFEGIVYYITPQHLQNLVEAVAPVACVLDYIHSSAEEPLHPEAQKMMDDTWHSIEQEVGQDINPTYYDGKALQSVFKKSAQISHSLSELQTQRTGRDDCFDFLQGAPWVQVALF